MDTSFRLNTFQDSNFPTLHILELYVIGVNTVFNRVKNNDLKRFEERFVTGAINNDIHEKIFSEPNK